MSKGKRTRPTESDLLKALGELEQEAIAKAEDETEETPEETAEETEETTDEEIEKADNQRGLPKNTKQANGGLSQKDSDDPDNFETDADEGMTMKSMVSENDDLRKGFEVSAFLEALVEETTTAVDGLSKSVAASSAEQRRFNKMLAKAVVTLGNKVNELSELLEEQGEAPVVAGPRSITKSMGVQQRFPEGGTDFSKSEVLQVLGDLAVEQKIPALAVSSYEVSNYMDPHVEQVVRQRLMERKRG